MDKIPEKVSKTFSDFCKMYDWSEHEVLTYLMLYALEQGIDLAIPIQRLRIQGPKWIEARLQRDSPY